MPGGSGAALKCIALDMLNSGDQLCVCVCVYVCVCVCVCVFLRQIVCVLIHAWGIWCCINVHCAGYAQQWSTNPCLGNASYEAVLHQPPVMALARSTSSCSYIGCKLIAVGMT